MPHSAKNRGVNTIDNNIPFDFSIQNLGECTIPSPVIVSYFTLDSKRLLFNIYLDQYDHLRGPDGFPLSVEVAGPREKIFFDPSKTKAAIVTCGGLCPGINNVVRTIVMELHHRYGVRNIMDRYMRQHENKILIEDTRN